MAFKNWNTFVEEQKNKKKEDPSFTTIQIENTLTICHKYGPIGWTTIIPMPELKIDIMIKFNPTSNLYKEETYMSKEEFDELGLTEKKNEPNWKKPTHPPVYNCIWMVSKWTFKKIQKWACSIGETALDS